MQTWMAVVQVVLLVLGVPLAVLAFAMAIFAGAEGSPAGQHAFVTLLTVPVAYLVCLIASVVLAIRKKGWLALTAAGLPFAYLLLAFVAAAVWTGLTSS